MSSVHSFCFGTAPGIADVPSYLNPLARAAGSRAPLELVVARLRSHADEPRERDIMGRYPLHWASWNNAAPEVVEALLNAFPQAGKEKCQSGRTPLHYAAWGQASTRVVSVLTSAHPEMAQVKDRSGMLPLHLSVESKCSTATVAAVLAAYPRGVFERDRKGLLPLHLALVATLANNDKERTEVVAMLMTTYLKQIKVAPACLSQDAELRDLQMSALRSRTMFAPLFAVLDRMLVAAAALGSDRSNEVLVLAEHGAAVDGCTQLQIVRARVNADGDAGDPANFIANITMATETEINLACSPLMLAAGSGHPSTVNMLLLKGAYIERQAETPAPSFQVAVEAPEGQQPVQQTRVAWVGVGGTALFFACAARRLDLVALLIDRGADIEALADSDRRSPLHRCIASASTLSACPLQKQRDQHLDVASLLLSRGANIDAREGLAGRTALMLAAEVGGTDACVFLARRGANIEMLQSESGHAQDQENIQDQIPTGPFARVGPLTALMRACLFKQHTIVALLLDLGALPSTPSGGQLRLTSLGVAVTSGHVEIASLLLHRHPEILEAPADACGSRPLHLACRKGDLKMATMLIFRGASLKSIDSFGRTPLHVACSFEIVHEHFHVVDWETPGESDFVANDSGATAKAINNCVELLLNCGARSGAIDARGRSALHLAAERARLGLCVSLVSNFGLDPHSRDFEGCTSIEAYGSFPFVSTGPFDNDNVPAAAFQPTLSETVRSADQVLIATAHDIYLLGRRNQNWLRRRYLLQVVVESGFRPLEAKALEMESARALLDPTAETELPPVVLDTPEKRRAHYMGQILTNDGLLRLVVSFL